jgi:hypothetical protein
VIAHRNRLVDQLARVRRRLVVLQRRARRELRAGLRAVARLGPRMIGAQGARVGHQPESVPRQRMLQWDLANPDIACLDDLRTHLGSRGARFAGGVGEISIPSQACLDEFLGQFVHRYPDGAGFTVVDRDAAADGAERAQRRSDKAHARYALGRGPRPYDVAELVTPHVHLTCLVVQHDDISQHDATSAGEDVQAADSPHSLPTPDRETVIRDVLRSTTDTLHFGNSRLSRGGRRYLYQSVPGLEAGKRDTEWRWRRFTALLAEHHLGVEGRVVFDVGCNAGMMLARALADGAYWGVGWDRPQVAPAAERVQCAMGNTRTTFIGADLQEAYPLSRDVPAWLGRGTDGAVLLYLAVWRHLGLLHDVKSLPWSTLLFEGHQSDAPEQRYELFREIEDRWNCRLLDSTVVADGDSDSRPVALFVRR